MILAGDIGGTKAELGWFDRDLGPRAPRRDSRLATRGHATFDALLAEFMAQQPGRPERAVFGIAGPVRDNRCEATNLPWRIDGDALGARLGVQCTLLNDLATTAMGLPQLGPDDLMVVHAGVPGDGPRALIAAGTGLGEAIVAPHAPGWLPIPTEGGHTDFGPRNALEDELLQWLRARYGRVSYERILSGPGIADLYRFLTDTRRGAEPPAVARRFATTDDPAAVVTETALDGSCERSGLAIGMFIDVYGAEAGNLALKSLALGGVYLGGGIAPRLGNLLLDGRFMRAFRDKGRLSPVLEPLPVSVILDPRTALWGAASYALTHP